ncbi:unnamed protein product [Caenorhabditis angaria]|uniref:Uncharacterized protein n=1 Tax=Caenorhabditis angaria TaxID=860376 RepID=A0A9P1I8I8_9PELO|nr:unnamed protein product [Caenorhabditis angaria]
MKRAACDESEASPKKQKAVFSENVKEFDDFLANLKGSEIKSLKFIDKKSELHIGLENNEQFVFIFSDSIIKLEYNEKNGVFAKSEVGKSEQELISKYFQIIIEKSADFLKNIEICSKDFPFSSTNIKNCKNLENLKISQNGNSFDLIESGFLSQETIFEITGDIWIHGVSLDGNILDLEKMKLKKINCDQVTGRVHNVISNYLNKFKKGKLENVLENVDLKMIVEKEKDSDVDDEEDEDAAYYRYMKGGWREEMRLHDDFDMLLWCHEPIRKPFVTENEMRFGLANETHQIEIDCDGKHFNMCRVEREDF